MKHLKSIKNFTANKYILPGFVIIAGIIGYTSMHAYAAKPAGQPSMCSETCVSITHNGFSQSEIAIKVGEYIEFKSADGGTHDLALGEGAEHGAHDEHTSAGHTEDEYTHDHIEGTNSGEFGPDEAWKVQFKKAGSYIIHDHMNPESTILVVAYEPNSLN